MIQADAPGGFGPRVLLAILGFFKKRFPENQQQRAEPDFVGRLGERVAAGPTTHAIEDAGLAQHRHQLGDVRHRKSFRGRHFRQRDGAALGFRKSEHAAQAILFLSGDFHREFLHEIAFTPSL